MHLDLLHNNIEWQISKPKYLQLAEIIISYIESGELGLNEKLPSVNQLSTNLEISRETVFKALNYLSERGIIKSSNRQGYFVINTNVKNKMRVFFLMDKLTTFKEELFLAFQQTIAEAGEVEVFFHHHNFTVFRSLIINNLPHYTHFVILTFLKEDVGDILNQIPAEKRVILDSYEPELKGKYSMVYQDFAGDIIKVLEDAEHNINKYKRLILIAPDNLYHGERLITGFKTYAKRNIIPCKILDHLHEDDFKRGDIYITLSAHDRELVQVIKLSRQYGYEIGEDIGVISYNDTPVKEVLAGGISVISTDFKSMGHTAAQLILNREIKIISNPTQLILRNSL